MHGALMRPDVMIPSGVHSFVASIHLFQSTHAALEIFNPKDIIQASLQAHLPAPESDTEEIIHPDSPSPSAPSSPKTLPEDALITDPTPPPSPLTPAASPDTPCIPPLVIPPAASSTSDPATNQEGKRIRTDSESKPRKKAKVFIEVGILF
ncbi:hypothetical protein DFH09DRAFT_1071490 [Mycena vulgaris]|nr:hypothetical protein DFH09DRAFT_1071490 [Mycena vulgaris]